MHSVIYGLRKDEQIGEIDESDAVWKWFICYCGVADEIESSGECFSISLSQRIECTCVRVVTLKSSAGSDNQTVDYTDK